MATGATAADDAASQIREMDAEFERNANSGNVPALVDGFYADDAQLLPPNSPKIAGKEGITAFWSAIIAAGASGLHLDTTEISVSGDLAYGVGGYTFTLGGATQAGKYLVVYRRQADGRYRAIADMFSPNA